MKVRLVKAHLVSLVLGLALACSPMKAAGALAPVHDLERTQVRVTFRPDGTFLIDVLNAPIWLLERLEPFTGEPASGRLEGEALDRRLAELEAIFGRWVWVYFDGARLEVEPEYIAPAGDDDPAAQLGTMRLTGTVPAGARTFSWAYGLVVDPYPMLLTDRDGRIITHWVQGDLESDHFEIAAITAPSRWQVVRNYLWLGFTHILPKGLDHILFVMGIYLLSTRLRPILVQVTTFTVAHTITLGLTIFGVLSLPSSVVEPMIALSIVYVAIENLITSELKPWRVALVFGFGLLHGMGFAGVLSELGLPPSERVTALLSFNVGVEGGQLTVIAMMFLAVGWLRHREWYRRRVVLPISLAIAAVGLYWTVTRLMAA
jgi:hydrogenase/urease accessory protein HupE